MQSSSRTALAGYITGLVDEWVRYRDSNYEQKWSEYYRLYRGIWVAEDKNRRSERSRIVTPGTQDAVESTVAAFEEAVFSNKVWFDLEDDVDDQDLLDMFVLREHLREDLDAAEVPAAISQVFLLGAVYGTGIAKIVPEEISERRVRLIESDAGPAAVRYEINKIRCFVDPVLPQQFAIDPAVTLSGTAGINQGLGVAHIIPVPKHRIVAKQRAGLYFDEDVGASTDNRSLFPDQTTVSTLKDQTKIVEYHGLVPKALLLSAQENKNETNALGELDIYDDELIEAIVTVANGNVLLRAEVNDSLMGDRAFVAFAYDTVPGRFWGAGVAEKSYNPQKSLDAIVRAQLDGLALSVHPMVAGDVTRLPRGTDFTVYPGRTIPTIGDPSSVLREFKFPGIDAMTWNAAADMERYLQKGAGYFDPSTPLRSNRRNDTLGGMSIQANAMGRRTKRAMLNAERQFLVPLIKKVLWRYYEYDPNRYPPIDFEFKIVGTMGLMARESEQQQIVQVLNVVPPEAPAFNALIAAFIKNTSISNKEQVLQSLQPQPKQPSPEEQIDLQGKIIRNKEVESRIVRNYAKVKGDQSEDLRRTAATLKDLETGGGNNDVGS